MNSITAYGVDYFKTSEFPLRIGRSQTHLLPKPLHLSDLTHIEHHHDFNELVIVNQGYAIQRLDGVDIPVSAGQVYLLQGEQRHFFHQAQQLELINIMYDPEKLGLPENELRQMPGYCAMFLLEPQSAKQNRPANRLSLCAESLIRAETIASQIEQECEEQVTGYIPLGRAKLIELITFLSRSYEGSQTSESQALFRIGNVIGALERDYTKDWTMQELVEIAHMSKSSLFTIFKKATGHTIVTYLMRIRIQHAINMLKKTDQSITEISFAVGFNDSNYFCRKFKKATGKTARQYRIDQ